MAPKPVRLDPFQNIVNVNWPSGQYVVIQASIGGSSDGDPFSVSVGIENGGEGNALNFNNGEFLKIFLATLDKLASTGLPSLFVIFSGPTLPFNDEPNADAFRVIFDIFLFSKSAHEIDTGNVFYHLKRKDGAPLAEDAFIHRVSGTLVAPSPPAQTYGTADVFVASGSLEIMPRGSLLLRE